MSLPNVDLFTALESAEVFVDGDWVESKDQDPEGDVRLIQLADVGDGVYVDKSARFLTAAKARALRCTFLKEGDVLVARMPDPLGRACIFPGDAKPAVTVVDVCIIRPRNDTHYPRWLMYTLNTPNCRQQIAGFATGTTRSRISRSNLGKIKIPVLPLGEQRRIAEVLDRTEALRAKRRAALAQLDTLTQSIFLDLFGDAGSNPKGWPMRPVSDYVAEFQGGKSIEAESGENTITVNRVLKISAVTGMKFLSHESKPVPDSYQPPREHFTRSGDLLFSRANTTELVGAVAYVEKTPSNLLLPDKLWRFVWRSPSVVEPLFVWALFQTRAVRSEIARRATGTSGSMKNISQEKVFGIRTILPPISLQRDFTRRIAALEKLKATQHAALAETKALFAILQRRAFRGEL